MLRVLSLLLVLGLASATERKVLFDRKYWPTTWTKVAKASPHQRMGFVLALRQKNLAKLEEKFWQVSDPKHPDYQKFMTTEELDELTGTSAEEKERVLNWLHSEIPEEDRPKIVMRGDSVLVQNMKVSTIGRLFNTTIYIYTHDQGHTILRSFGKHSVPATVGEVVEFAEGITDFPMHRSSSIRKPRAPSDVMIVPQSLASLYKFEDAKAPATTSQMPAEFQGDSSYSPTDLKTFFSQTDLPDETVSVKVGPFNDQYPDVEASLDTQYITAVGLGVKNYYWTSEGWMYTFATNLMNYKAEPVPNVVSMSWGWSEQQQCGPNGIVQPECKTLGVDDVQYVDRVNTEFMKLGLKGISLFASSGDSGANGRTDETCTDKTLHATFPAASVYLTAVGATQLPADATCKLKDPPKVCANYQCASAGTESAVSFAQAGFTSGGGFSKYMAQPKYQKAAVESYLQSSVELPPKSYYNASGRGYPDVSAMGSNFLVYMKQQGGWIGVGGTSASSPTWGGVAGRLNDISKAKTPPSQNGSSMFDSSLTPTFTLPYLVLLGCLLPRGAYVAAARVRWVAAARGPGTSEGRGARCLGSRHPPRRSGDLPGPAPRCAVPRLRAAWPGPGSALGILEAGGASVAGPPPRADGRPWRTQRGAPL